ncbi:glycyl aminopeptidase [Haladaptatus cibarius]|uniref:glycyl aminopeptidase n=1 Tax=Haladaptatus cibarius TaxID=453847 RepID=UPI000678D4CE|nr:glycyl aminopeptidase [Haladaptatus cibarius]
MALGGWVSGKTVSLVLVCLLVAGAFAPPATAQSAGEPPDVSISIERPADDSTTVQYQLDFDAPAETESFWLINYTGTVVSSDGFVSGQTQNDDHALRWDGETESPSVTVSADVNGGNGREFSATNDWILSPTPQLSVAWMSDGSDEWQYRQPLQDDSDDSTVEFSDSGVLGSAFTYVGDYEEHTHRADGQRFKMVVVEGANPAESPADVFESWTATSKAMPGKSPDEVLAFVLPDPSWRGGFASPEQDELWVHEDARLSDPQNLWIHEYVHTRQSFELGEDMTWFREASAAYLASDLSMEQGRTSPSAVAQTLTAKDFGESVLSKSNSWENGEVPYYRGAYTLWALDAKIQQATDGEKSLLDVFDRMNGHEGTVSYADFQSIVAEVSGQPMNSWLDQHVTTAATPELQTIAASVDDDSTVDSGSSGVGDSNGGQASGESADDAGDGSDDLDMLDIEPLATTGDLQSTLILWGGLGLIGVVFGLTIAQYVSGLMERIREK